MRVKKFLIKSSYPEDETFDVTREVKLITITKTTTETDDNGNVISARRKPINHTPEKRVEETITAVGVQSGQKAEVQILETNEGLTDESIKEIEEEGRERPVNLKKVMEERKIDPSSFRG